MSTKLMAYVFALLLIACGASRASAEQCPRAGTTGADAATQAQSLEGRLIYHDDIRQWYELKLDRPRCGQRSIQLTAADSGWKSLEILGGCRIESTGKIDFSGTGYYSLDLYQRATRLKPVGACVRQPPFADYSNVRPDRHVRAYRVVMHVDYGPGDHPVLFHVRSGRRELRPWQAYASYMLTGGFVLYGQCGHGFVVDKVFGTPAARPFHFAEARDPDDMAAFDPEGAAQSGIRDLHLGFTCIRSH